ncbi:calmodulin-like [Centruroides sculpturatus]|uniref:calmodulin-like n=1 Tax=Centruroides sculpturatus TaxID=218467 RepID=UPI000C6E487D|nr:calmodulin-like [Centruroides sculpturatus]XP_023241266.1 calmodulin-like [Centruroides sculpturatus]
MAEKKMRQELEKDKVEEFKNDNIKEVFSIFNSDDDCLSGNNLRKVMKMGDVDLSEKEIRDIIKAVDPCGKGNINYAKLISMLATKMRKSDVFNDADNVIVEAFKVFDKDNKGIVKVSDLLHSVSGLEPKFKMYMEELVLNADPKKTGQFNYHEFIQKMQGKWKNYLI